jgi:EpsI family protein
MLPGNTRLIVLTALISVTAAVAGRMPTIQTEVRAESLSKTRIPMRFGHWTGKEMPVAADVQKALPTAKILSRAYQCDTGTANLTIVAGTDATVLHDPHDCLSGEGWQFLSEQSRQVDVGLPSGPIQVRDVVMAKDQVRAHMWYWYAVGDGIYNSTLPARLGLFRTRLTEGRGRRAEFVRLIVGGETESGRSAAMLTDLAGHIARNSRD